MHTLRTLLILALCGWSSIAAAASSMAPGGGQIGNITVKEEDGSPSVSSVGTLKVTDGTLTDNGDGSVSITVTGGVGAPDSAKYITQTPDATLSAEQALSALATGILKNTTTTGVLSIATAGTDYPGLAFANIFTTAQTFQPATDVITGTFRRNGAAQTSNIIEIQTEANALLASIDKTGAITAPSFTASGATTGIVQMNGSTSGAFKLTTPDATGQTVTLQPAAQTSGAATFTLQDAAGVNQTIATIAQAQTLTNKTLDAEGTGNLITIPKRLWFPAAGCNNATAGSIWDLPTSNAPAAACITGTNTQKGVLDFDDTTDESAQVHYMLPSTWTGTIDARIIWYAAATTGSVGWCVQLISTADAETDDPAYPAQGAGNCVSDAAKGTTNQVNIATITTVTATGVAASELLHIQISRDANGGAVTDDMTGDARLIGVELVIREAI